jgi:transposase
MPWTETNRERYALIRERYASDLSDKEFALVQPLLPNRLRGHSKPAPQRHIHALFDVVDTDCLWG